MKNGFFASSRLGLISTGLLVFLAACGSEVLQTDSTSSSGSTGSGDTGNAGGAGGTSSSIGTGGTVGTGVAGGDNGCAVPPDAIGNCAQIVCLDDGTLATIADPSDIPLDDGLECTQEACIGGSPVHPPAPAGTPCAQGSGLCDGLGNCAQCLADSDCPANQLCTQGKCTSPGTDKVVCGCKDGSTITTCATLSCFSSAAMDMVCGPLCAPHGGEQSTGCLQDNPFCYPQ